jgi:hemerythrin
MAYMEWVPAFEVGQPQIDEDHRTLVERLNQLHRALDQGQDPAEIARVLNFLRDYTVTHFSAEEALMIQHKYPQAAAHFAAHAELPLQVSDFNAAYRRGRVAGMAELLAFLEA